MNEKRNEEKFFNRPENTTELNWNQLLARVATLESRAKLAGAFAILQRVEALRKTMARSGMNKKIMRAVQIKLQKLQAELSDKKNSR